MRKQKQDVEPETRTVFAFSEANSREAKPFMDKFHGEGRSGSRTGPEVMTAATTKRRPSVRPDFSYVSTDKEEWHECR